MKRKGFTLIELLVVIAIIGILATIILVSIANARPRAQRASALESLNRVISTASVCREAGDAGPMLVVRTDQPSSTSAALDLCTAGSPASAKWTGNLPGYNTPIPAAGATPASTYAFSVDRTGITRLDGDNAAATPFTNLTSTTANFNIVIRNSGGLATGAASQ